MRALVIGGTRFIGAHVTQQLCMLGDDVTVFHRGKTENAVLPKSVKHICDDAAAYPILRFPKSLPRSDWDAVIHMLPMGEADTRAAVEYFSGHAGRLVLISSGDVYRAYGRLTRLEPGSPDPVPLREDAPLRTKFYPYRGKEAQMGAYAHDYEKILAERAVMEMDSLPWTVLRLPKVYGPEDNANLATIYMAAAHPNWRWTHGHVDNVAAAIVMATSSQIALGRIYNVGEEHTPSMGERLARLPRAFAPPAAPRFDFSQSIVYDTSRIRAELDFAEILDETAAMLELASRTRAP
jgi:nucleoside-diphosphate-sugar epimerase